MATILRRDPSSLIRSPKIAYHLLREVWCRQKRVVRCLKSWILIDLPCSRRTNWLKSNKKKSSTPFSSRRRKPTRLLDPKLIGRPREEILTLSPQRKLPGQIKITRIWTATPDHWHRLPKIPYPRSSKPELVKTLTAEASKITSPSIQRNLPLTPWWWSRGSPTTKRKSMVRRTLMLIWKRRRPWTEPNLTPSKDSSKTLKDKLLMIGKRRTTWQGITN